ncbi:aminoacetone oxidase family FAD-binding enzyme [Loktanella sp. D2R18]|uniref:TIGR03862 family flavoprotein n=1 Tax=Rhodobacterales TaxID=204455 RepID=UPI000DE9020A|nr:MULTISPECIES: TIGR03862 family flavoprotein [Rhodobacterales]MDO6591990.1 TIGR03862 family flavoprotein [Yoonia sp. 1_MG-2023]RBW46173.1 aminoacetone oxidase family FAD-binding enzyme [Loktanella sp. D2R18]
MTDALVIGAGPAGLMAAEVLAKSGLSVTIADAMPSVGRKFLMAGKSGLNLTKMESMDQFLAAYGDVPPMMRHALMDFGPDAVAAWAQGLGQPLFTGSTGRLFPVAMKASPLLRAWVKRLNEMGVTLNTRWRWTGWQDDAAVFQTPKGEQNLSPKVIILALGGASWARLGSDGAWVQYLPADAVTPFAPANMGMLINWSDHMERHFGTPVKACMLSAGDQHTRGEFVISAQGIEGGGVYMLSKPLRLGAQLYLDLLPDWSLERVRAALAKPRGKFSLSNHLRKVLKFDPLRIALLMEFGRPMPDDIGPLIKALPIAHNGPRPIDEAISTAGGVGFDALTDGFMLRGRPGVFCAGEMLDWEAPTGGYLITGCLATGAKAAHAAIEYASHSSNL